MTLGELADALGGDLKGDSNVVILNCATVEKAGKGSLTYVENEKYLATLENSGAAAIIKKGMQTTLPAIEVEKPLLAFAKALEILHPGKKEEGVHQSAVIDPSATVGKDCCIGPHVTVGRDSVVGDGSQLMSSVSIGGDCRIGEGCILYPGVTVYDGSIIGDRVILHAGVVIGADGFRYVDDERGRKVKVPHIGIARIGDDVEIQANSCVDRAMLGETVIGNGVKIDNLVQVGHNAVIGDNTVIAGQSGFSGSVRIGKNVVMGGLVAVTDHVEIADGVMLAGRTGVTHSIKKAGIYGGFPAQPIGEWRKSQVAYKRGAETLKRLQKLEKTLRHAQDKTKGEKE
jgi:UDP-3-O-[3-hydroxymyristoyl] glucosamine N-acyltransferase